jgi:two-component system cell cycle response regulator CtrA
MRVLLVEKYRSSITSRTGDGLFLVICAEDADEVMVLLRKDFYALVLLNMSAAAEDGLDLIPRVRIAGDQTPVLALTGPEANHQIKALRLGADDVLADPVDSAELGARVTAIVRRRMGSSSSLLRLGGLSLCLSARDAQFRGVTVELTPKEFSMLELMVRRKGSALTRTTFLHYLYTGTDRPESTVIDGLISSLRDKLALPGAPDLIVTIWGNGYRFPIRTPVDTASTIPRRRLAASSSLSRGTSA